MSETSARFLWPAIGRGAVVAAAITVPLAIFMEFLRRDRELSGSSLGFLFLALILCGFAVGGFVTAKNIETTPLMHAALAALVAFVIIQGFGIIRRLLADEAIAWDGIVLNALLAASFGMIGGWVAMLRSNKRA